MVPKVEDHFFPVTFMLVIHFTTIEVSSWRIIGNCLSLLNYSEKSIRKLAEMWKTYSDKLSDPDLFSSFQAILKKAKKFAKPEVRSVIDEFELKINTAANRSQSGELTVNNQTSNSPKEHSVPKKKKKAGKNPSSSRSRGLSKKLDEEEEDDPVYDDDEDDDVVMLPVSSDEEDEQEQKKAKRSTKKSTRKGYSLKRRNGE